MYSAATGMVAQQTNIDAIAHNLANVNTTGFKKSRVNFQDLLYETLKAPGADIQNGGRIPDEKTCRGCHEDDRFHYDERLPRIAHPRPSESDEG